MLGAMLAGMVIAWERSLVAGVVVITLGRRGQGDGRDGAGLPGDHAGAAGRRPMARPAPVRRAGRRGRRRHLRRVHLRWPGSGSAGWPRSARPARCARSCRCRPSLGRRRRPDRAAARARRSHPGRLDVMQPVGTLIGSVIALVIMWQCWQRRINPVLGLGMAMGAFVLLAPGDPALVPAVGGPAAGRVDRGPALPQGDHLADGAVLGDDHAQRRDHPGLRHRPGGGGRRGRRRRRRTCCCAGQDCCRRPNRRRQPTNRTPPRSTRFRSTRFRSTRPRSTTSRSISPATAARRPCNERHSRRCRFDR